MSRYKYFGPQAQTSLMEPAIRAQTSSIEPAVRNSSVVLAIVLRG